MRSAKDLLLALSFLSRLVPAGHADAQTLGRSLTWFVPAGLIIGGAAVLLPAAGLGEGWPLVQAWIMLGTGFWLTRGLHWDGWSDLWDAWGSGVSGEGFWKVLKDSRVGAFGVSGLVLGLTGQLVLLEAAAASGMWSAVIWAAALGRMGAVMTAWLGKDFCRPGLGSIFVQASTWPRIGFNLAVLGIFGLYFLPWETIICSLLLCIPGFLGLKGLMKKQQGLNGDFLGAAVVWGEISGLAGAVLCQLTG